AGPRWWRGAHGAGVANLHTTGLIRCSNGAATSLHFPVAVTPERNANCLAPATTEPSQDTYQDTYPGKF
ncbi:MAG: hypothetical protein QOE39_2071, partial [Bradyrhizobium sp.]|nr:hypothetical protein [Bradyrhizobium sp.]